MPGWSTARLVTAARGARNSSTAGGKASSWTDRLANVHGASARVPEAVSWLAQRGFEPQFGAPPLRRAIQREVDNRLSRLMLDGRVRSGQRVRVVVQEGDLDLEVEDVREAASAQA